MFIAICYFSIDASVFENSKDQSHFIQKIKNKVFARFKLLLSEVGEEGEVTFAAALVNRDEGFLRSFFAKLLEFVEVSEGIRLKHEKIEVMQN